MSEEMRAWADALSGQQVGGYVLGACIGHGGFGIVFEASSITTSTKYAMKVLLPTGDPGSAAEFEREGVLLGRLVKCSSVINLIESGSDTLMMHLGSSPLTVLGRSDLRVRRISHVNPGCLTALRPSLVRWCRSAGTGSHSWSSATPL